MPTPGNSYENLLEVLNDLRVLVEGVKAATQHGSELRERSEVEMRAIDARLNGKINRVIERLDGNGKPGLVHRMEDVERAVESMKQKTVESSTWWDRAIERFAAPLITGIVVGAVLWGLSLIK